jgi:hypothetical protein
MTAPVPISITNHSHVILTVNSSSSITATQNLSPAIACSSNSVLSLSGSDHNSVLSTTGGSNSPGIGVGSGSCDSISFLSGRFVIAGGSNAPAIGTSSGASSELRTIRLESGFITAIGTFGIGANSEQSRVDEVILGGSSGTFTFDCLSTDKACINSDRIVAGRQKLDARTTSPRFTLGSLTLGPGSSSARWIVHYRNASERESLGSLPLLHLGSLGDIPEGNFTVLINQTAPRPGMQMEFSANSNDITGIMVSLPGVGVYEVTIYESHGLFFGYLCSGDSRSPMVTVADGETFYKEAHICLKNDPMSAGAVIGIEAGAAIVFITIVLILLNAWRHSQTGWVTEAMKLGMVDGAK